MSDQRIIELSQRNTLADNDFLVTDSQTGGTAKVPGSLFNNEFAAMQNILGAKNLLPNDGVTKAESGVTFTVNSDGSVTVDGTATANTEILVHRFTIDDEINKVGTKLVFSGSPDESSSSTYYMYFNTQYRSSSTYANSYNVAGGQDVEYTVNNSEYITAIYIVVLNGKTASNKTFYPMLRLGSIPDNTYVPYAKTNKVLTDDVATLNTQLNKLATVIDSGYVDINRGTGLNEAPVTFDKTFTSNPYIFVSISTTEPERFMPSYANRSKTGFTARLYNNGTAATGTIQLSWVAIQP